jgi:hypothetical protein
MTLAQTPIYGIKYIPPGMPVRETRIALEQNAFTIEAALAAGGTAPPGAADLAAVAGRVSVLEHRVTARHNAVQPIPSSGGSPTPMIFSSATSNPGGLWNPANPTRLAVPGTGEYDLTVFAPWTPNPTGTRGVAFRILQTGPWVYVNTRPATGGAYGSEQAVTAAGILVSAGQYLEVGVWQDSGGSLNLSAQSSPARAALRRVA